MRCYKVKKEKRDNDLNDLWPLEGFVGRILGWWFYVIWWGVDLKRFTCYVLTAHGREAGKKGVILRLFGDCRFKNDREIYKFSQIEREIF